MEAPINAAQKPSEFQILLETLKREIDETCQFTSRLGYMSEQLKQLEQHNKPEDEQPVRKEPQSITEHLWEEIYKLRQSNKNLSQITQHLYSVVGG